MKIAAVEHSRHRIELVPPFLAAWDPEPRHHFEIDLVRVRTDDGRVGVASGDSMAGFRGHEHLFIGRDPRDLDRHLEVLENLSFHYGRCWAFDLALWDLVGQERGEPCWRLLAERLEAAATPELDVYASLGAPLGADTRAKALELVELGFRALKLRFHDANWRKELAIAEKVRAAIADGVALMVDCNQAWRMPGDTSPPRSYDAAADLVRALGELDVLWVEEPLHRGDFDGMRRLREETGVAIAGGEMARELHDLQQLIAHRSVDVLQPDATLIGGLTGLARIAAEARAHGIQFTPHTWGNGIGLMANAHLAAGSGCTTFVELPYDPPTWTEQRRDFALREPVRCERGKIHLSGAPGLGVELDEDRLAATRVDDRSISC